MDETKGTTKDSLQKPGQASKGAEGNTSKETEPQTYTQEQLDQIVVKAKSDALATAGRTATVLEVRETTVKAREDAIKAEQERRDAAELAEAQKDPDKFAEYQGKKAKQKEKDDLAKERDELTRDKAEHAAAIEAAKENQRGLVIWEIATKQYPNNPERVADLAVKLKELNIEDVERLGKIAEAIASDKPKEGDKDFEADNALTKGGSGEKSEERRLKERYPTM